MWKNRSTEGEPPSEPKVRELVLWFFLIVSALTRLPGYESFGLLKGLDIFLLLGCGGWVVAWFWIDYKYRKFIRAEELADAPERPPWA